MRLTKNPSYTYLLLINYDKYFLYSLVMRTAVSFLVVLFFLCFGVKVPFDVIKDFL